jgi:DNA polymerase-3 subunit alpha
VATNDSHYLCEDDSHAHEIMLCVQTAASIHDPKRMKFDSDQFFVKSAAEMEKLFSHAPQVVSRTMQFAERCSLKLQKVDNPFPEFAVPLGHTVDSYFEEVCRSGFRKRLDTSIRHLQDRGLLRSPISDYESRLERELEIIKQMKFPGYFLIVWDFIRYAREHDIPVGPGRGSAAGSLATYCMEITDIDPLQNAAL